MSQSAEQIENLEHAFQTFNQMSEQLMGSYRQLETQVDHLKSELTSVRRQKQQLAEQKNLNLCLERLLHSLPGGVVVLDGKGVVREANPAAEQLLGAPLVNVQWREIIARAFKPLPDDGHDVSLCDGRRVNISTSSLGNEPGQVVLITDVSETRQLQDKVARLQRLSSMGQMAASLAHQIRTPAASALLYVGSLNRHRHDPEAVTKYSEKIREQLNHIETMVRDMLVYAKGGSEIIDSAFTADDLVRAIRHSLQAQAEAKGYRLVLENSAQNLLLTGNREALFGALVNLINNAFNAAGAQPLQVNVRFQHQGTNMLIRVSDNGTGIADEIKHKIFEPFITTKPQGTGLGLAVVKSVIEKHAGHIAMLSQAGQGTEFVITLPAQCLTRAARQTDNNEERV